MFHKSILIVSEQLRSYHMPHALSEMHEIFGAYSFLLVLLK